MTFSSFLRLFFILAIDPRVLLLRKSVTMLGYALRHKTRALGHRSYKDAAYYDHELQASYLASQARYFWRLLWDSRFRCLVLQEDWIRSE